MLSSQSGTDHHYHHQLRPERWEKSNRKRKKDMARVQNKFSAGKLCVNNTAMNAPINNYWYFVKFSPASLPARPLYYEASEWVSKQSVVGWPGIERESPAPAAQGTALSEPRRAPKTRSSSVRRSPTPPSKPPRSDYAQNLRTGS